VAIAGAALSAFIAGGRALTEPKWPTDFDQMRFAVHALVSGRNPYHLIGPGLEFGWEWGLYYPIHAVLLCAPFAWLPVAVGRVAFATIAGGVLAYALAGAGVRRLPAFLSAAFIIATSRTQWSPLITAAILVPVVGCVIAAKPNIGLAAMITNPSRKLLIAFGAGAALLAIVGWILLPTWLTDWLTVVRRGEQKFLSVFTPVGALMLLALLRWRRPESRLLIALSCIPRTPSLYDLLPLFVIPRSVRESCILALGTHALFWTIVAIGPFQSFDAYAHALGRLEPIYVYLPALVMILRRPNVSDPLSTLESTVESTSAGERASPAGRSSRIDLLLVAAAILCSAALVWVTTATRRI
jgi:hypothetical protein